MSRNARQLTHQGEFLGKSLTELFIGRSQAYHCPHRALPSTETLEEHNGHANEENLKFALSALAAAGLALVATSPADAATKASTDACPDASLEVRSYYSQARWSMYGDLYDGKGKNVHHWKATGKKGLDIVSWHFGNCGDGGWAHLWVDVPGKRYSFLGLPRTRGHCFEITNNGTETLVASCTI